MLAASDLRGEIVARVLAGAWRDEVEGADVTIPELEAACDLILDSGAGALAWRRVAQTPAGESPAARRLRDAYRWNAVRAATRAVEIRELATALRGAGIDAIIFKGWAAARLYAEAGLRPSGDIDVLIRSEDAQEARRVVAATRGVRSHVDLHADGSRPNGYGTEGARSFDELHARAECVDLDGVAVDVLGPEDHLRVLCLHFLGHGGWRALWLCDIAAALERSGDELDWERCVGTSGRVADWVRSAGALAHDLLGARVPEPIRSASIPPWLPDAVLAAWTMPVTDATLALWAQSFAEARATAGLLPALRTRWANPVQATVLLRRSFGRSPRLPLQAGVFCFRTARYALEVLLGKEALSARR